MSDDSNENTENLENIETGNETADKVWNDIVKAIGVIGGVWAVANIVLAILFFALVDAHAQSLSAGFQNLFRRLLGFGRNFPLTTEHKKISDINVRIDLLEEQLKQANAKNKQSGGGRKSYSLQSFLIYSNICIFIFGIIFISIVPSIFKQKNDYLNNNLLDIPAFTIS